MKLNDIPEVSGIDTDGFYKFMLFKLIDGDQDRLILRAVFIGIDAQIPRRHEELHLLLCREVGASITHTNLGGGILEVRRNATAIDVFAASHDYGSEPDRRETVEMLRRAYPNSGVADTT